MTMASASRRIELPPEFEPDRWVPPAFASRDYRVSAFMRSEGISTYQDLYARAAEHPEWFYPAAHTHLGIEWMRPWERLVDDSDGSPSARWFVGGGTNLAWLAGRRQSPTAVSVIWEGDDGTCRIVTGGELQQLVSRAAAGLRNLGVGRGDVVTMHLPMVPEAVVTLLACARIGAICAPAFSGYAVDALAERVELAGAKVVITADGMLRRGREVEMAPVAEQAGSRASTRPQLVVVERLGNHSVPAGALTWDTLLAMGEDDAISVFDAQTPWLLAFTSGSTGRPKGIVHTQGGIIYDCAVEFGLEMDVRVGDRMCWPSDMGWLAGPLGTVTPLVLGATPVLFEGVATHPESNRLWRLIDRHQITHIALPPTVARMLAHAGSSWVEPFDLETLRIITSTGEPWDEAAWRWVHRHVGRGRAPIINWSGGTEVGGGILAGNPIVPTQACRFSGPALGKLADVVDETDGSSVRDRLGELVVRRSWPAMTRGFWQDESSRYLDTYWSRFPGLWVQGDRAIHHADGTWSLVGRSDDVIKVAGKRIGPVEYETIAAEVPGVQAAAAVGLPHPVKGEVPVIAVLVDADGSAADDVRAAVFSRSETTLGSAMRPFSVVVVPTLPMTRSGKVHRRVLRAWLAGIEPGDLSSVESLDGESAIRAVGQKLYEQIRS